MLTEVLTLLKMMAVRTCQALVRQAVRPQAKLQVRRASASRRITCKQMAKSNTVIIQYVSMCPPPLRSGTTALSGSLYDASKQILLQQKQCR